MFFMIKYVDGDTLNVWLKSNKLYEGSVSEVEATLLRIIFKLALGIAYMHSKGVLHYDIKLDNILMTLSGDPVVSDFGVSARGNQTEVSNGGHAVEAVVRGHTPKYSSARLQQVAAELKRKRGEEREQFKQTNKLTHAEDIFCFAGTVLEMYAVRGWLHGNTVAELWAERELWRSLRCASRYRGVCARYWRTA